MPTAIPEGAHRGSLPLVGKGPILSAAPPVVEGGGDTSQVASHSGGDAECAAAQLVRRIVKVSHEFDLTGLEAELDRAAALHGLARCVDEIVLPATRHLRRLLATGRRNGNQELFATEAVRSWLNHQASFAPSPRDMGPVLLACGPRDRRTVDIESLALLLRFQRWPCRVLGARVSTFTMTVAAQASDATGVVVFSTESQGWPNAVVSLRAVDALGVPVFFAGQAFQRAHNRRQLPGQYLGTRAQTACAIVAGALATVREDHRAFPPCADPGRDTSPA